jgi:hypothetical protein
MYLSLPDKASLNDLDLKYSQNSKLYPDNDFKISYQETQFENTLKITQSLSGYEFFIFEYGKLLNESSPRNTQFYGFSWFIDDMSFNEGIQKRVEVEPQNQVCDIYSDFFLGVDITMELDFPKAEELAYSVGYKKTGLCGDQRIIDDHLKNLDIELYKKSLEILKNRNGFENLEKDVNIFRNFNKDFKVISFLSA